MTWSETCRMYREKYPTIRKEQLKPDPTREANVYAVVEALSSRLSEDQITVVGNGSACVVGGHAYIMKKGQRFLSNSAIASIPEIYSLLHRRTECFTMDFSDIGWMV